MKVVFQIDLVFTVGEDLRRGIDFEKYRHYELMGPIRALRGMTSTAGELMALSGKMNPYPDGELGVIEPGAYADILLVEGNPLED
jgi:imidazolonepropionase-like amidohydrolase